jgi:hypothetical protein
MNGLFAQTDSVKMNLIKFLINKKDLVCDFNSFNKNVLIVNDIVSFEKYGKKQYGIFKFGTLSSHSFFHMLLKNKQSYTIIDMRLSLEDNLLQVVNYFKEVKVYNSDTILNYFTKIIELNKRNSEIVPWKNDE